MKTGLNFPLVISYVSLFQPFYKNKYKISYKIMKIKRKLYIQKSQVEFELGKIKYKR